MERLLKMINVETQITLLFIGLLILIFLFIQTLLDIIKDNKDKKVKENDT